MSRAFWFTSFAASGLASIAIHSWADTRTDAEVILTILVWTLFLLAVIDVARTSGPGGGPTLRNP